MHDAFDGIDQNLLIPDHDLERLRHCQHHAPHDFYGWHATSGGAVIRTRQLGATSVEVLVNGEIYEATPIGDDIWVLGLNDPNPQDYRLRITWPDAPPVLTADAYAFLPTLGNLDIHLIAEGRHERLWDVLGANVHTYETNLGTVHGTAFAVWAPNALGVAVVGDFCGWNASQYPMRSLGSSGVWEIFIPGIGAGETYKFAIQTQQGNRRDKADPMAKATQAPPETTSVVVDSRYDWNDGDWLRARSESNPDQEPMSIYEVHLGSWKIGKGYKELATELVDYVADQGYTHVEFMPVAEHPFGGSWGYQVSGYFAPTARWGSPDELRALIEAFHQRGIGVIVDWVPAHFPKDDWALARFDGPALYEHPDWRRGEQKDWGTYVFDFGRNEVRNFLVANALYWIEEFHIDGLRVDAVASMLYLDYSREDGEWEPNQFGGRENLEAVQFLQEMNATVHRAHPGVLTIAEESTSWPGVTAPTEHGGLGFSLKWNMGWMNDTLEYFKLDPVHREYHHNEITFSMIYQYSEKYVLPFSHDEVVHGKGSLWGRMPGDDWNKAAGLRALFGYMFSHPGKKLMFMGQEFGQTGEWNEAYSIDWSNLEGWGHEFHVGIQQLVKDIHWTYRAIPALHSLDSSPEGFQWIKGDAAAQNLLAFVRWGTDGSGVLSVINLSGSSHPKFTLGSPRGGRWELVLNSDDAKYAGAGNNLPHTVSTNGSGWDGFEDSLTLDIPANSVQWYRWVG